MDTLVDRLAALLYSWHVETTVGEDRLWMDLHPSAKFPFWRDAREVLMQCHGPSHNRAISKARRMVQESIESDLGPDYRPELATVIESAMRSFLPIYRGALLKEFDTYVREHADVPSL